MRGFNSRLSGGLVPVTDAGFIDEEVDDYDVNSEERSVLGKVSVALKTVQNHEAV